MTTLIQHQKLFNMLLESKEFADKQNIKIDLTRPLQEVCSMTILWMKLSIVNELNKYDEFEEPKPGS